jgi:hypothetical protein
LRDASGPLGATEVCLLVTAISISLLAVVVYS